jgi:glucan phosphoethanolaminetransferase (alkaline phosphatase superfamily)
MAEKELRSSRAASDSTLKKKLVMKKLFFLLIMIFGIFTFFNAQEVEKLIKNNNEFLIGKIDNSANLKVLFETVSAENQEKTLTKFLVSRM